MTPLSPEQIVWMKMKLDEIALGVVAPNTNARIVESRLSPAGEYSATVSATSKGYVKGITCAIRFTDG